VPNFIERLKRKVLNKIAASALEQRTRAATSSSLEKKSWAQHVKSHDKARQRHGT
jgi:hypothetical protein